MKKQITKYLLIKKKILFRTIEKSKVNTFIFLL